MISSETPVRIDIGGVDQVDAGIDAEVDLPARLVEAGVADLGERSLPPNVMVPMVRVETFRPERPSVRYSIGVFLLIGWSARKMGAGSG